MRVRTVYILFLGLMAVCLFALDRNIERTYRDHDSQLLAETAHEHARLCEEYFGTRISATKAVGARIEGTDDQQAARCFRNTCAFITGHITGIQRLLLLDGAMQKMAEWPEDGSGGAISDDLMRSLTQEAAASGIARVSGAFRPAGSEAHHFLIAVPVDDGSKRTVICSVELSTAIAPPVQGLPISKPIIYLEDSAGTMLAPDDMLNHSLTEQREAFTTGKSYWAVHVQEPAAGRSRLFLSRLAILALGVLLLTIPAVIYLLHAHQYTVLVQTNAKLESELGAARRFNARLIRLNYELDEFTNIVSHDLKEPLRGVEGLSRLFMEEYGEKLDEQGKEYLRSIRASGARMRRLVDELLHLSRIGRRHYPPEEVDFNDLLREVLTTLQYIIAAKSAVVTVQQGLPRILCDRVRTAELFQNLLSNALKFSGERKPEIQVGCRLGDEEYLFWVKDNGVGVAEQDQSRIFQIFQRLDPRTEGSGVGLTICKRIVETQGGRIWVESELGVGSTFLFTMPRRSVVRVAGISGGENGPANGRAAD